MTLVVLGAVTGVPTARLPVDVALENADAIHAELGQATSNHAPGLILDLAETRYLDSAGIEMLFRLRDELANRRQRLAIVAPAEAAIRRVLELTGLDRVVTVVAELPEAVTVVNDPGVARSPS